MKFSLMGIVIFAIALVLASSALATNVASIIDTDTIWNKDGSPYHVGDTVQIAEGAMPC